MAASIGCAIHCALMPLVFAYLPMLGLGWLADEGFHRYMAVICFALAMAAFVPGWKKHGSFLPLVWGVAGLILINYAAFGLEEGCCSACAGNVPCGVPMETTSVATAAFAGFPLPLLTPLGGILLVVGHVVNHGKRCQCQCCHESNSLDANSDDNLAAE
jgi:hypothetical protein